MNILRFLFGLATASLLVPATHGAAAGIPGESLVGPWQGALTVSPGVSLRLVLHVSTGPNGTLAATLDSPDQGAKGIPVADITLTNQVVRADLARLSAVYEGQLSAGATEINGHWKQGPNELPLVFRRVASAPSVSRPQEPKRPYPYKDCEVTFPGGSKDVVLAGTLSVPNGEGPFPAVVLITGTGAQDRDEFLWGHRPFLVLADHLTRHGIAVLRYDDRGVGRSTGKFGTATYEDFAADARAAFEFLKAQPGIDPARIGLCGHSEGGLRAMIVAAEEKKVAFTVSLAGVAIPLDQLLQCQRRDYLRAAGMEGSANPDGAKLNAQMYQVIRTHGATEETRTELRALLHKVADFYPPDRREAMGYSETGIAQNVATMTSPWFVKLLALDPSATIARVHCPVLALNGEKDIQVAADENLAAIRKDLAVGGNTAVTIQAWPGLNHLFQHSATGLPKEYGTIEETMSPQVLACVSDWIRQQI